MSVLSESICSVCKLLLSLSDAYHKYMYIHCSKYELCMTYHGFVTRLTRWVPLVEQDLLTLPGHLSSPDFFCEVRPTLSLVSRVCFVDRCLSFSLLAVVLSVLLPFTDPNYPFDIFKLFFRIELTYTCYFLFFFNSNIILFKCLLQSAS